MVVVSMRPLLMRIRVSRTIVWFQISVTSLVSKIRNGVWARHVLLSALLRRGYDCRDIECPNVSGSTFKRSAPVKIDTIVVNCTQFIAIE